MERSEESAFPFRLPIRASLRPYYSPLHILAFKSSNKIETAGYVFTSPSAETREQKYSFRIIYAV